MCVVVMACASVSTSQFLILKKTWLVPLICPFLLQCFFFIFSSSTYISYPVLQKEVISMFTWGNSVEHFQCEGQSRVRTNVLKMVINAVKRVSVAVATESNWLNHWDLQSTRAHTTLLNTRVNNDWVNNDSLDCDPSCSISTKKLSTTSGQCSLFQWTSVLTCLCCSVARCDTFAPTYHTLCSLQMHDGSQCLC